MHAKRIENIFKLKKIAWAENDSLPWMLLRNPLGARVVFHRAVETETAVFFAKMWGEEEEREILLLNSVNVVLPRAINGTGGLPQGWWLPAHGKPCSCVSPFCWRRLLRTHRTHRDSRCLVARLCWEHWDISVPSGNPAPAAARSALALLLAVESQP